MFRLILWVSIVLSIFCITGCSEDDNDNNADPVPHDPTSDMLAAGPETGKQFISWNDLGRQRATAANFSTTGWCYQGQDADIDIPFMCGLHVPSTALIQDSLQCTMEIVEANYSQTEYYPDGIDFADSITYWIDTTCVDIPSGSTAADIVFYYYSRNSGSFYTVPTMLSEDRWKAKTTHFSRYILGQKRTAQ